MDLQTIVYIVAIIYMLLWIGFLIVGIALLWKILDELRTAPKRLESKIAELLESRVAGFVTAIGIPFVSLLMKKMKEKFSKAE